MTEVPDRVKDPISSPEAQHALCLLRYYGFELDTQTVEDQMAEWLEQHPARMIVQGIVEALYQGRYKIVSVNQILSLWHRRGQTICHFSHEFERLVGGNLPAAVQPPPQPVEPTAPSAPAKPTLSYREMLLELPSVRAASKLRLTEIPAWKLPYIRTSDQTSNGAGSSGTGSSDFGSSDSGSSDSGASSHEIGALEDSEPKILEFKPKPPEPDRLVPPEPNPEREFKEFKEGVIFALSSGLAAHTLKPRMRLLLSRLYRIDWLQFCTSPKAIDQFIPTLEPSEFHNKLRTVAEPGEAERQ